MSKWKVLAPRYSLGYGVEWHPPGTDRPRTAEFIVLSLQETDNAPVMRPERGSNKW